MAKTTPTEYVKNKVTQLAALTNDASGLLFAHVGRTADISLERIRKIPAFPACLLTNLGGELNDANNEIWTKQLSVTLVFQDIGDTFMDEVSEDLDRAIELVIVSLQADRSDDAIMCVYESEDSSVPADGHSNFILKSLIFEYEIDRSLS